MPYGESQQVAVFIRSRDDHIFTHLVGHAECPLFHYQLMLRSKKPVGFLSDTFKAGLTRACTAPCGIC